MSKEQGPVQGSVQVLLPSGLGSRDRASPVRRLVLPLFLFTISLATTTAIGARYMQNFLDGVPPVVTESDLWPWPWLFHDPSRFELGWPFSLTLLAILLTHEFGHYFACRAHGVRCTLPWVLPAPTLSGTAGAVIQIRSRIPNRRALIDVGAYGPLAGYAASLIAVSYGFLLSRFNLTNGIRPLIHFGEPATLAFIHRILYEPGRGGRSGAVPLFSEAILHPVLIAGWIGLFITALNLIPSGQLDGGHILYAISPKWHRLSSRTLPFVLVICGILFWIGWLFWGVLLLVPAMRHPVVVGDESLGARKVLALLCLCVFLLTFVAAPFTESSIRAYFH